MVDTTTWTTPPTQDLQINLEEAPKTETPATPATETPQPELDLSLDLNLPEVPKNDDRLKAEDQKNAEMTRPTKEELEVVPVVEQAGRETPVIEEIIEPISIEPIAEAPTEEIPVVENKREDIGEPIAETPPEQTETPPEQTQVPKTEGVSPSWESSASTETEQISTTVIQEPITTEAPAELANDMKIIEDLNMHASAWWLASEANITTQTPPSIETPKTFDLDAMLGTPPSMNPAPTDENLPNIWRNEDGVETTTKETPAPVEQIPSTPTTISAEPMTAPAFTLPTTQTSIPSSAIIGSTLPSAAILHNKTKGVKTLLFVVLFAALGFTTYFILKTMYPLEFANMFGWEDQMHASEEIIAETGMVDDLSGAIDTLTGEEMTGATEDTDFWELNDLETETPTATEETDLSKLTDYVNKGNELLAQGKAINNNTVIKYGLYISKKATDFLTKIANGEEIDNLSWYFAQFDQYIAQLEAIITPTPEPMTEEAPMIETETSSPSQEIPNEFQDMTPPTPEATTE